MRGDFFAIIPARAGSKGIKNKNMIDLNGVPLIQHTINSVIASKIDDFVISTDSQKLINYCLKKGYDYIKRPNEISKDESKAIDVVNHVLETKKINHPYIVYLQPTSPLRTEIHINEAMELILKNPEANSLVSVVNIPHNFVPKSLMKNKNGYLVEIDNSKIYNRHQKEEYYARNGAAIYITKRVNIKDYIFGGKILGYKMSKIESIDIDEESDLKLASLLLKNKNGI